LAEQSAKPTVGLSLPTQSGVAKAQIANATRSWAHPKEMHAVDDMITANSTFPGYKRDLDYSMSGHSQSVIADATVGRSKEIKV